MSAEYSRAWEDVLVANMHFKFEPLTKHTVRLGPLTIWISNYPYNCFTSYNLIDLEVRPSRKLIYQLREKLIHETI